jgi:hypothetical protein
MRFWDLIKAHHFVIRHFIAVVYVNDALRWAGMRASKQVG